MADQIVVRIPASTSHIALVRATASALAALLDFTYDRIMDLHIAIDEVCSRILTMVPQTSRLQVVFTINESGLNIDASGDKPLEAQAFLNTWSRAVLDSITAGLEVFSSNGVTHARFEVPRG